MRNTVLVVLVAMLAAICLAMPGTTAQAGQDTGATPVATDTGNHAEVANLKCPCCCPASYVYNWSINNTAYRRIRIDHRKDCTAAQVILSDGTSFWITREFRVDWRPRTVYVNLEPITIRCKLRLKPKPAPIFAKNTEPEPTRKWPHQIRV